MRLSFTHLTMAVAVSAFLTVGYHSAVFSNSGGPSGGYTNAPGESNCNACHNNTIVANSAAVTLTGATNYTPGGAAVSLTLAHTLGAGSKSGFQLKAVTSANANAGTLAVGTGQRLVTSSGRSYLEHSTVSSTGSWTFRWTPPATNVGNVSIYAIVYNGTSRNSTTSKLGTKLFTLSPVTALPNPFAEAGMKLFPNPATFEAVMSYTLTEDAQVSLQVAGIDGKVYSTHSLGLQQAGANTYRLPVAGHLPAGTYFIRLLANGHMSQQKLVVE